jgi:hypothetical protein
VTNVRVPMYEPGGRGENISSDTKTAVSNNMFYVFSLAINVEKEGVALVCILTTLRD